MLPIPPIPPAAGEEEGSFLPPKRLREVEEEVEEGRKKVKEVEEDSRRQRQTAEKVREFI